MQSLIESRRSIRLSEDDIHDYFMNHPDDLPRIKYLRLIEKFVNDLRYLRHLGLPDKTYDAYIKLDNEYQEKLNE